MLTAVFDLYKRQDFFYYLIILYWLYTFSKLMICLFIHESFEANDVPTFFTLKH